MKSGRRRAWLAFAVAGAFVLAACGGSDSDTEEVVETTDTVAATDTTVAVDTAGFTLPNFTPMEGAEVVNCAPPAGEPIKAAWIYVGPINDGGWTQAHHEGLKAVQAALGDQVITTYKENIPEGPQAVQTIDQLVADGNTIIFANSYGYQDAFVEGAAKYPDVCFEHMTGYKISRNLSQSFGAGEDGKYLSGIAAGADTKNGKIGVVAPFPIPEVIRGINAFALGARSVNPSATIQIVWTNTWFDPALERKAAESLIAAGVDTLAAFQDSPATGEAAKVAGLGWAGYGADHNANFPDIWLNATIYQWAVYEVPRVKAALEGRWIAGDYYGNLGDGFIKMSSIGKRVSADTVAKIAEAQAKLAAASGSMFTGPINAQDGTEKIAAGVTASHGEQMGMDYLVEGIIGDLPKG